MIDGMPASSSIALATGPRILLLDEIAGGLTEGECQSLVATIQSIHARGITAEFLAHSNEELVHADLLAARIVQLGGEPDFAPDSLTGRSHAQYMPGTTLVDMIREDLVAERVAITSYRDMIRYLGHDDPTTSDILKGILAVEEEHADELADLLQDLPQSE